MKLEELCPEYQKDEDTKKYLCRRTGLECLYLIHSNCPMYKVTQHYKITGKQNNDRRI